jgi:uncharacterized DUF497 family protein
VTLSFSWDRRKASSNLAKHGVSFDEARTAFFDESALVIEDPDHSDEEDRFVLLGISTSARVLVVVHCIRAEGDEIRLISARKATKTEHASYAERKK